jgi:hypothetical protein
MKIVVKVLMFMPLLTIPKSEQSLGLPGHCASLPTKSILIKALSDFHLNHFLIPVHEIIQYEKNNSL